MNSGAVGGGGSGSGGIDSCSDTPACERYSSHSHDLYFHNPSHNGHKLSLQPIERYDEAMPCCLPPPSPAPNSDRCLVGLTTVSPSLATSTSVTTAAPEMSCGGSCPVSSTMLQQHDNYDCSLHVLAPTVTPATAASATPSTSSQIQKSSLQQHQLSLCLSTSASSSSLGTNTGSNSANSSTNNGQSLIHLQHQSSNATNGNKSGGGIHCSPNGRYGRNSISDRFIPDNSTLTSPPSIGGSQSNSRFTPSSTHIFSQNIATPLMPTDTYSYLSSTVHTPVKRYVPTPPMTTNELYSDAVCTASATSSAPSSSSSTATSKSNIAGAMYTPTLKAYHMKCCSNNQQQHHQQQQTHMEHHKDGMVVPDYYDTPNRHRSALGILNCDKYCSINNNKKAFGKDMLDSTNSSSGTIINNSNNNKNNNCLNSGPNTYSSSSIASISTMKICSADSPMASSVSASTSTSGSSSAASTCRQLQGVSSGGRFMYETTPSADYLSSNTANTAGSNYKKTISNCVVDKGNFTNGRVNTPVSLLDNVDGTTASTGNATGQSADGNGAQALAQNTGTCLHCNTVRRTTGVHQTTQTTGPISPIPALPNITATSANAHNQYSQANGQSSKDDLVSIIQQSSPNGDLHCSPLSPTLSTHQLDAQNFHVNIINSGGSGSKNKMQQTAAPTQSTFLEHNILCHQQQHHQKQQQHIHQPVPSSLNSNPMENQQQHELITSNTSTQQTQQHFSRKKRLSIYVRKEIARFFGIDESTELEEYTIWQGRQRRLAMRRFGSLKNDTGSMQTELNRGLFNGGENSMQFFYNNDSSDNSIGNNSAFNQQQQHHQLHRHHHHHNHIHSERPDILPAQDTASTDEENFPIGSGARGGYARGMDVDFQLGGHVERKSSVAAMIISCFTYILHALHKHQSPKARTSQQWSRSFAPKNVTIQASADGAAASANIAVAVNANDIRDGLQALQEDELFFDAPTGVGGVLDPQSAAFSPGMSPTSGSTSMTQQQQQRSNANSKGSDQNRPMYIVGERVNGWRTSSLMGTMPAVPLEQKPSVHQQQVGPAGQTQGGNGNIENTYCSFRGKRISPQLLDGVLENSRRPMEMRVKLFAVNDQDDRPDYRPFFTYWINTVQILVVFMSIICYGIGPIGIGVDQRTGQVLVTSLSLQTVQHTEQRNIWIGPKNNDLVHMGAKFATCMRRDVKIMNVLLKTRRQERETACCIRNDDSGCVQSSQADCSVRGLFPTKSISTWKKWSPGESGPGGRISGSVCGLDPKYCDSPASIAPYEWPDDITKWPICRKTNSFSHRFRYKDHTAEHMVCEVIGHPCCTGVYGECRITTREYCDFVNGYFHEEASLCSQISCLNNVCGMFPFMSIEVPDQFYRLFTSLCLHAGILHLIITVAFQHVYLADLERLIGPLRTAIVYIGSGLAGNLTSAVLVPYKPEVGPLASLVGVLASLTVLLIFMHWKHLRKPYVALFKLILMGAFLFAIGTLPWQLNFAGLIAGILCAIVLTIALVPFVSINKYKRKNKINLIWFCIIIHSILYLIMFIVFYVFPMELTNFNFGEIFNNNFNPIVISNSADYISSSLSNNNRYPSMPHQQQQQQQLLQQQQHYYHHQSNDIINNAASLSDGSNIAVNKFL